jgi:nicotinamidase-related amidase
VSAELLKYLRDKGVDTVILTGTSANSTVLFAAGGAADTGFKVIVPVDGIPADTVYQEQFTCGTSRMAPSCSRTRP